MRIRKINSFWRSVVILVLGTGGAQFINLISYPILSRLFTPEQFGILAILMSVVAIFVVIATGQYEKSIVLCRSNKDAINAVVLVLLLFFVIALVYLILLFFFNSYLKLFISDLSLLKWLWFVPLFGFCIIIYNSFNEWCVRNKLYKPLSANKMWNAVYISGAKMLFGFFSFSTIGLLFGEIIGRIFSSIGVFFRFFRHRRSFSFVKSVSYKNIQKISISYLECPRIMLPAVLLDSFTVQLPIIIITFFFGSEYCGYFSMALMLLSVPTTVVGVAVGDVFRQQAVQEYRKYEDFTGLVKSTLTKLMFFSIPLAIIAAIIIPFIIPILLGTSWDLTGLYATILLPYVTCNFLNNSINSTFIVTQRFRVWLRIRVVVLFVVVIGLFIGGSIFHDMLITVVIFSFLGAVMNVVIILLSIRYAKVKLN